MSKEVRAARSALKAEMGKPENPNDIFQVKKMMVFIRYNQLLEAKRDNSIRAKVSKLFKKGN